MNTRSIRRAAGLIVALAACTGLLVGLNAPSHAGDKGSKDRPTGKWTATKLIENGRSAGEAAGLLVFEFKGDEVTLSVPPGKGERGTFKVDTGKTPKQFEMTLPGKKERDSGIYKIEKDVLTLCFCLGKERPTKFESTVGSRNVLIVLKRGAANLDAALAKAIAEQFQLAGQLMTAHTKLRQIGNALHNYHDTYGKFPAHAIYSKDGKPLLSWRVAILPFIEEAALYKQFKLDESWDSAHNKKLLAKMPPLYAPVRVTPAEPHTTFYQVFVGPGAAFEGDKGLRMPGDFPDGTSNTLLVVEAGQAVPWTKPADLPYDPKKDLPALGGDFKDAIYLVLADASARSIRRPFDVPTFRLLITRNDGKELDWKKLER